MPLSEPIAPRKPRATSPGPSVGDKPAEDPPVTDRDRRRRATAAVIAVAFMTALGLALMDAVIRLLSQFPISQLSQFP
ncbi:hypothetical protein E9232_000468 [Inquilinus ginsengisoli]|uniref:MFS transporter n=1 Tax=Inquilinus ginsengisoli TaxID=363840 RepID=A0ABU1JIV8_9PROT|nr:hypothetical protein [Inquilinus ginsengisoli]MDR6287969.1 hypothetical protein [Inquilinus ginsengisoli]